MHVERFVVWTNGTRCRDGVKLLWCHSHLVWLVFEGSIPTCACFHSENFYVTLNYKNGCMDEVAMGAMDTRSFDKAEDLWQPK